MGLPPGAPPKHPSVRARRNNPKKDFRSLSSEGRKGPIPEWPLAPDIDMLARAEVLEAKAEHYRIVGETRRAERAEEDAAVLRVKAELYAEEEQALWAEVWRFPQAIIWEETHAHREVAQYVRWKIRAEQGDHGAGAKAQGLSDRLGLNPMSMMRLRIEIEAADAAQDRGDRRRQQSALPPPAPAAEEDPRGGLYVVK